MKIVENYDQAQGAENIKDSNLTDERLNGGAHGSAANHLDPDGDTRPDDDEDDLDEEDLDDEDSDDTGIDQDREIEDDEESEGGITSMQNNHSTSGSNQGKEGNR